MMPRVPSPGRRRAGGGGQKAPTRPPPRGVHAAAPAGRGVWRGSPGARRRRAGARASERASRRAGGRVRRVLAAERWRLGGSDSLTPARPDQSRLRERAGGREEAEAGEAERLSPGRGAGRDPASAAPGPPDRGRGTPLARPLVRPRGRARRQPGKTKQTRSRLPLCRVPAVPSAPCTPPGQARGATERGVFPRGAGRGPPHPA